MKTYVITEDEKQLLDKLKLDELEKNYSYIKGDIRWFMQDLGNLKGYLDRLERHINGLTKEN